MLNGSADAGDPIVWGWEPFLFTYACPSRLEERSRLGPGSLTMSKERRERKAFAVRDKIRIIDRVRKGERQAKVSRELGLPESTLRGWLKDEAKIRAFIEDTDANDVLDRKRTRKAKTPLLDSALFSWYTVQRSLGVRVTGSMLQAQANKVHSDLEGPFNFKASNGWLHRFQKRHGINQTAAAAPKSVQGANGEAPTPLSAIQFGGQKSDLLNNSRSLASERIRLAVSGSLH